MNLFLLLVLGPLSGALSAGCGDNDQPPPVEPGKSEHKTIVCERLPAQGADLCTVTPGGASKLLKGTVLTPDTAYIGGRVSIDAAGIIQCVGCDCADDTATTVTCPGGVISPGLINTHDHITFAQNSPVRDTGERYEHRHDWRSGLRGHTEVPVPGSASADAIRWGELRFIFGGGTSTNGSGGQAGLLRNLDRSTLHEGLTQTAIHYQTFPLGDSGQSTQRRVTCNYGVGDTTADITRDEAYTPHVAEGIDQVSRNEFLCTTSDDQDKIAPGVSTDLFLPQTAAIHGTGLLAADFALMAQRNSALIWSPRTNVALYGDTAQVTTAARLGVQIALGTDWISTGSTNMLRELKCASDLSQNYYDGFFSDLDLWRMATVNAAASVAMDDAIGVLDVGRTADISIFDGRERRPLRAIIDAAPKEVALVMRGGKALYGDHNLIAGLRPTGCDAFEMCGAFKQVCLQDEIGKSWGQLTASVGNIYPAFYCGAPANEPTCKPSRPKAVNGSTVYTGDRSDADPDGDGLTGTADNCPRVFNPIRPLDNGKQADADADSLGDPCDPCPLTANATECVAYDPKDRDADGRPDASDNCPAIGNANQVDADADGKGDACDDCAMSANPGAAACPSTIYGVKNGTIPMDAQVLITNALVTGKGANGFFIQVKETDAGYAGPNFSGLFVFTTNAPYLAAAVVGGRVTLEGQLTNFFGQLEITNLVSMTRVGATTEAAPAPTTATIDELRFGGARGTQLESVIVRTGSSTVTAFNTGAGEFTATQAALSIVVDDFLFTNPFLPGVDQSYTTLTGILAFRNNANKLEPRDQADLSPTARLVSFSPGTAFIRNGQTAAATIPTPVSVRLTMPVQTDTVVAITSSDTNALTVVDGAVTIPAGQTSAAVLLNALAPAAAVTLTATLGTQTFTAAVRVLDAAEVATTVTMTPASVTISPGGTATFTVSVDLPASAGGAVVALAQTPADAGTLPASVTIAENQTSATFSFVDARTTTTATLTATFAASTDTSALQMVATPAGLIINEVEYDNVGTDTAEYIEIYNGTSAPIDLANVAVVLVNGNGNVQYERYPLASAGALPAGGYLVVGPAGLPIAPGAILVTPTQWKAQDNIQNGAPDGVALVIVPPGTPTLLDALSYEGSITAATLPDFTATVNLVEGTALAVTTADSQTVLGSLCRVPNGSDSNNAITDWKFSTTPTPGAANVP